MNVLGSIGEGLVELTPGPEGQPPTQGFGGDAANVLVMAAQMGARTRLLGRVGDDPHGRGLVGFWTHAGVDTSAVRIDPSAPTGTYVNQSLPGGDHRFTYHRAGSAGSRLDPGDLTIGFLAELAVLVVTGVTLAVSRSSALTAHRAMAEARGAGIRVVCVLNHRPALGGDPLELAALAQAADIVVGSREDAVAVFGTREDRELAAALGPDPQELALTDGPRPASVTADGVTHRCEVPPQPVRNAAGAGDAFAGAYLAARLEGRDPRESLRWGVAASSLSVRQAGCAGSYPTGDQVRTLVPSLNVLVPL